MAAVLSCSPTAQRVPDQQWMPTVCPPEQCTTCSFSLSCHKAFFPADLLEVGGKQAEGVNWIYPIPFNQFLGL